jgi:hypothetical protein
MSSMLNFGNHYDHLGIVNQVNDSIRTSASAIKPNFFKLEFFAYPLWVLG